MRETAIAAAKKAGKVLLEMSKDEIGYSMKNSHDILSEADLKSEKIIIDEIKKKFPEHNILAEESGEENNSSEYLWIIDPLDGTINFSRKIKEYCISIAVEHKSELILGLIYRPATNELFIAEKGKGSFLNDMKLKVSDENELINMLLATDNTSNLEAREKNCNILSKIWNKVRHIRIFGSGALHLARVGSGKIDVYYTNKFNYWDHAAGIIIIKETGGKVTDFEGNEINKSSKNIIASNNKIHEQILEILNS